MSNLLCLLSICITGCHGNDYILYSLNDFFLKIFFFIWLVQVNKLASMRNCPGVQDSLN